MNSWVACSKQVLQGKIILVTGAGRGLGHGVARAGRRGATVLGVARTEPELLELATAVGESCGSVETYVADLSQPEAVAALTSQIVERHGGVDAIVNNAAILRMIPFVTLAATDFDETIAVNLLAPVRLTRAFLPAMQERGRGAIVNVSSAAGILPFANETDYCASKYGLEGFSYSLAMELSPLNISVNLVSPGFPIKPTSITAAEFAAWPAERRNDLRARSTWPMRSPTWCCSTRVRVVSRASASTRSSWRRRSAAIDGMVTSSHPCRSRRESTDENPWYQAPCHRRL